MATTASETAVQELYISYFGRPADPAGLAFYADALDAGATTINAIASSFSASIEAQEIIALDTDAYLTAVYLQAFARAYNNSAGADGTFWADAINSGQTTKELAMVQILSGAQGDDSTAVENKVAVATAFTNAVITEGATYASADASAAAKAVLDAVTSDAATVDSGNTAAQTAVTALVRTVNPSTFTLVAFADSVDEPQIPFSGASGFAAFTLTGSGTAVEGDTVTYTISGVDSSDVDSLTGTATLDADLSDVILIFLAADATTEGPETLTVTLSDGVTASIIVNDTSLTPPTLALASDADSVDESGTATFSLTGSGTAVEGDTVIYEITGIDTNDTTRELVPEFDFQSTALFVVTLDANLTAVISIDLIADRVTEGAETLTVTLKYVSDDLTNSTWLIDGIEASTIVNDTSLTSLEFALAASADSVDEGGTASFTVTGSGTAVEGDAVTYEITGIDSSDTTSDLTGTATLGADLTATISVDLIADATPEGPETLTVTLSDDTVASITVIDSPTFALTASADSVDEGGRASFTVTGSGSGAVARGDVVTYAVTGTGISILDVSEIFNTFTLTGFVTLDADLTAIIPIVPLSDRSSEGAETLTVTLSDGTAASITVNDTSITPPNFALTSSVDESGGAADEVVEITLTGVALADGFITVA